MTACLLTHVLPAQCLKFKTDQQQDLKRVERLSNELFRLVIRGTSGQVDEEGARQGSFQKSHLLLIRNHAEYAEARAITGASSPCAST
jgi:hypothetical protein